MAPGFRENYTFYLGYFDANIILKHVKYRTSLKDYNVSCLIAHVKVRNHYIGLISFYKIMSWVENWLRSRWILLSLDIIRVLIKTSIYTYSYYEFVTESRKSNYSDVKHFRFRYYPEAFT